MALLLHFSNVALIIADVMNYRRAANRVPLPLIVVFVLSLLAFLPLAMPGRNTPLKPVQGYSTGNHVDGNSQPTSVGDRR